MFIGHLPVSIMSPLSVAESACVLTFIKVIKGIVEGCRQSDCTLMGGEVRLRSEPVN